MDADGFKSRDDLKRVVDALIRCADDAVYGRLFELGAETSNLFSAYEVRLGDLACMIEPDLRETRGEMELDFEKVAAMSDYCCQLSNDAHDRLGEIIFDTRRAYMTIGTFIGARIADPSGKAVRDLGEAWTRAVCSQPRHEHLALDQEDSSRRREKATDVPERPGSEPKTLKELIKKDRGRTKFPKGWKE